MKRIRSFVLTTIAAWLTLSLGSGSNALHAQQYSADRPNRCDRSTAANIPPTRWD
jgi:hypothetical protein